MINVADLVKKQSLKGNYFAFDAYIQGDFESGLVENRRGDRLLALPETLISAIHMGLETELGSASKLVLFNCGRWWGKNFYKRFSEQVSGYYSKPLAEMEMIELLQCLKQCWKAHGWGTFELDLSSYQQGFLLVEITNSIFAKEASGDPMPSCFLEAGILSAIFSQLSGKELHCLQISCESLQADRNRFVIGLAERLAPVTGWLEEQQNWSTIWQNLGGSK
ncbi:V4R domain-containing protein [Merismopedia glauca]|uniref:4-vinyl reductase n=1 Tax=Merismopedia glauca CCAP 1448/3 TaxID=1296344 RepID=A0A2T1BXJ6_9CYAN|nr:V4R domain-containing protein [Merismopedia glauca]PSB00735.1 4-vinyl reductase [Merismopedia glauca CCAP 1448/3]